MLHSEANVPERQAGNGDHAHGREDGPDDVLRWLVALDEWRASTRTDSRDVLIEASRLLTRAAVLLTHRSERGARHE